MATDAHSVFSVIGCPCLLLFVYYCALTPLKSIACLLRIESNQSLWRSWVHPLEADRSRCTKFCELPLINSDEDHHGMSRKCERVNMGTAHQCKHLGLLRPMPIGKCPNAALSALLLSSNSSLLYVCSFSWPSHYFLADGTLFYFCLVRVSQAWFQPLKFKHWPYTQWIYVTVVSYWSFLYILLFLLSLDIS